MPHIKPFQGVRYNPAVAPDLAQVTTPPYDVISPQAQADFYARDPHNFIRLELAQEKPGDDERHNRYTRAAETLHRWIQEGVLIKEEVPALYLYEQTFQAAGAIHTRSGMLALCQLSPFSERVVLPHEKTLPKAKADRLALMEATRSNFSPVFALYEDPQGQLAELITGAMRGTPDAELVDDAGVRHRLWVRSTPSLIREIQEALAGRQVVIADGHHRYETALNYQARHPASDHVLMMLVSLADPGLVVLPTHRLVKGVVTDGLIPKLNETFELIPTSREALDTLPEGDLGVFGLALGSQLNYLLKLKDAHLAETAMADHCEAYQHLDVAILHRLVFEKLFGLTADDQASGQYLAYVKEKDEAYQALTAGTHQLAFFLRPTPVASVMGIARAGEVMPQKSTFFYPKLLSGLVFHHWD